MRKLNDSTITILDFDTNKNFLVFEKEGKISKRWWSGKRYSKVGYQNRK